MERDRFRAGMRRLSGAVSIVTTRGRNGERRGITVTSVCSLSVAPPSLLVSVQRDTGVGRLALESGVFCVNLLARQHQEVAETFAGRKGLVGGDRFKVGLWTEHAPGAPRLAGAIACFDCTLDRSVEVATHVILIGTVAETILGPHGASPLVYVDGGFTTTMLEERTRDNAARSGHQDTRSG